ncbi:MAG: hypothetical protein Q8L49_07745 [Burkholderiaceae bacterium]|nr:hypothetical protein [Burkholderiaceae bacterium]
MPTLATLDRPGTMLSFCGLDLARPASAAERLAAVQAHARMPLLECERAAQLVKVSNFFGTAAPRGEGRRMRPRTETEIA